jgi:hypothetical protein
MPLTFATFKSQRFRWCFGGIQILRKHLRDMLPLKALAGNRLTLGQRLDYLFGTGLVWFNDLLYLGFTAVLLVTAYLVVTGQGSPFRPLFGALVLLPAALLASGLLRAVWSLRQRTKISVGRSLLALLNWLSVSWTVAIASAQALVRSKAVFMRTPKERERQTFWTALRDARTETLLALLLWAAGAAVAFSAGGTVFLVLLFAWQGMVYASAPLMSYLNVRTVLTPQLERRRRTELRRERRAALVPFYAAGGVAVAAVAVVMAVLFLGGTNPGSPPGTLRVPRDPNRPAIVHIGPGTDTTPSPGGSAPASPGSTTEPTPSPGPTSGGETTPPATPEPSAPEPSATS